MAATAVTRAQNRAIAKGTDPKAATCRAKLQRARSALNRQMDRELRLREGAENLLRATTKDGGSGDNSGIVGSGGGRRNKSKSRKLIRQTVALELSFLDSNVRLLADELAELNGSVDVYQHRDDDDDDNEDDFDSRGCDPVSTDGSMANRRRLRRQRLMPMIAVPLKDTRPIDFGPPLERFISQHYGVDLSATPEETSTIRGGIGDDGDDCDDSGGVVRRRSLSLREAIDELTQLRVDTQTPSRDLDGVRLLLRYYRQLYYVDRRFFPPAPVVAPVTTTPRNYHQHNRQQQDPNYRHVKQQLHSTVAGSSFSSPPPAIYFEWYDSFGGPVPSCGQRTVRFEQACVLFNVAAVHTQMGAKYDRRCRDDTEEGDDDDYSMSIGSGKRAGSSSTSTGAEAADGSAAATQCFLRAAGAYRHIGDTFANAPARAADLRATGVLYALMMAQAHECAFEKLQWRFLTYVRQRCRRRRHRGYGAKESESNAEELGSGDHRGRGDRDVSVGGINMGGMSEVTVNTPTWTELAREAAHVSRMYGDVVYNSCCRPPNDRATHRGKENGGDQGGTPTPESMLPDVWVAVCRIKDRHYAALAYRFAACALLPYRRCSADGQPQDEQHEVGSARRRSTADSDASQLLTELTAAAAAVGLEIADDDDDDDEATSVAMRQRRCRKQLGMLLLEAATAAHDRADRAQRLCRQLRAKSEGNTSGSSGGGGLLAGVLDRERQRTVRLLLLQRRDEVGDDEYGTAEGEGDNDRRVGRAEKSCSQCWDCRDCCSDDDSIDAATVADFCSGDQEEFTGAGIAGVPGLDVDRGVLIRPRTRFRLMSIAPDFTDTGDGDNYADGDDVDGGDEYDSAVAKQRGGGEDRHRQKREERQHEIADREERRADLFAGLGPVAVFSARHQYSRPRWVKVARGSGRHRSPGGGDEDVCDDDKSADPIQLVDRWFGFELRSHGGGTAAAVPPATVGHVRSSSQAQHVGLRRGDIVVALKLSCGDGGGRAMDVRWETCRRVAELIVHQHQRRRRASSGDRAVVVQLKVVTPITAATASDSYPPMEPNKIYKRRSTNMAALTSTIHSVPPLPPILSQSNSKQRRQRRQNANGGSEGNESTNKKNTWLWNPFRRRRRSVVGNKC